MRCQLGCCGMSVAECRGIVWSDFCFSATDMGDMHRPVSLDPEHAAGNHAHLDALEESVNRQIDTDVKTVMENFRDMIHLSRVRCRDGVVNADWRKRPLRYWTRIVSARVSG